VTAVGDDLLLVNPAWVPAAAFATFRQIEVHPDEPRAANALRIGDVVVYSRSFVRTKERLERAGVRLRILDTSELAKAEGGVTCCSLLVRV
jgi:dimethylargininase